MKKKAELVPGLGERIQKSRVSAKLTQAELAEKIDVSPQYISDLERSVVGASLNTLIGICKVLSVSSDYLLFGYDKENIEPLVGNCPIHYITENKGKESCWDMFLMTYCKDLVIANSSFSWWGAFLNNQGGRVYAPDPWLNRDCEIDIYDNNWIKINC